MKTIITLCLAVILAFSSAPAFAAHPLSTDDTGTQGTFTFQVEATGEFSWDKDSDSGVTTKANQQNLGVTITAGVLDSLDVSTRSHSCCSR